MIAVAVDAVAADAVAVDAVAVDAVAVVVETRALKGIEYTLQRESYS